MTRLYCNFRAKERFRKVFTERQHGCCAICGEPKPLVIDHDHETGLMRGLLCSKHNTALGLFGDNAQMLLAAVRYLNGAPATTIARLDAEKAVDELIVEMLDDPAYPSDRARARALAEVAHISPGTLQTRFSRARRKLKMTQIDA